jgi:hypothetical protein
MERGKRRDLRPGYKVERFRYLGADQPAACSRPQGFAALFATIRCGRQTLEIIEVSAMPVSRLHRGLGISRRRFLGSGALTAAAIPSLTLSNPLSAASSSASFEPNADFLRSALGTARWIQSAERQDEHGAYWLPDPDHPEKLSTVSAPSTIYSGGAGVGLFFIQLARATGEAGYLDAAGRGADRLAATWQDLLDKPGDGPLSAPGLNLSLYGGLAGTAFVLNETGKATGKEKYREAARAATDRIAQGAKAAGTGVGWSGAPGIAADGSIVLYLLYAAQEFHDDAYRVTAVRAGDHILEAAIREPRGGLSWRGFPAFPGLPKDAYFPNFEGGTAGVPYVLARLHRATGDRRYLDAAEQGAAHLQDIATVHGNAALIPYRLPDLADVYYLGFCHGPAGTARTFFELHRITRDPRYLQWTERLAQGVVQSGVPEELTPGYWNVVCQCCGSAAVIDLFVGLWASTGRKDYLGFAQRERCPPAGQPRYRSGRQGNALVPGMDPHQALGSQRRDRLFHRCRGRRRRSAARASRRTGQVPGDSASRQPIPGCASGIGSRTEPTPRPANRGGPEPIGSLDRPKRRCARGVCAARCWHSRFRRLRSVSRSKPTTGSWRPPARLRPAWERMSSGRAATRSTRPWPPPSLWR